MTMKLSKEELFREMLDREGIALRSSQRIARREGPREAEASFSQKRIWVDQMMNPGSRVFNILLALKIEGRLSTSAVAQALQSIVDRHESLRTCFRVVQGRPFQCVQPRLTVRLGLVDLLSLEGRAESLDALLACKQRQPFALDRAPLFDFTLVRLDRDVNVLLIALHHIIFDFVSSQVLFDEFNRLYESSVLGLPCPLPELRIHYLDFSRWQREQLQGRQAEETLQHWKDAIGSGHEIPVLDVPSDRPSQREVAFQPAFCEFMVAPDLVSRIKTMSSDAGLSSFCIWLAAFQILLHRYTDADEVLVCMPQSERNDPDLERTIGFFVNLVVAKLSVRREASFEELLREVNDSYLEAVGDRAYPFDKLVEALSPQRSRSSTKLGEVGLAYQKSLRSKWELAGLKASFLDVNVPTAKSELWLTIYEDPNECRGYFEFNQARFSPEMIGRMGEHYCALLGNLLASPQSPIGCLSSCPPDLAEAIESAARPSGRSAASLLEEFERQVALLADKTALAMEGTHLSYRALNRRANQVARFLIAAGVGPESPVGMRLTRGIDAYICLLAILKSGGVYVPMDEAHPAAYLLHMIETADIGHILACGDVEDLRNSVAGLPVEVLDAAEVLEASRSEAQGDLAPRVSKENTAYVCFTSGSTGQSKGVFVAHGQIASHLQSFRQCISTTSSDRVLQFAALTFDVSLEQVFSAWSVGATLLPRGRKVWSVRELADFLGEEQVTSANLPTAYWNQVVKVATSSGIRLPKGSLRFMIAGGEAMQAENARLWSRMSPAEVQLINAYGPTEAIITATRHRVQAPEALVEGTSAPIGLPLPGRRAGVCDRHGLAVPNGAAGELCLGGSGLAQGYLKSPRQTAIHFRPFAIAASGLAQEAGARMYATGDWVRTRPQGDLEFLQRRDDEVKIRGVRVVPSLIESLLVGDSRIVEGAVVVRERPAQAGANGSALPKGEKEWLEMLSQLPKSFIEESIREAAELQDEGSGEKAATAESIDGLPFSVARRSPEFDLVLDLKSGEFIPTPLLAQRNWVISRALDECADDLRALNQLTRRFVAGSGRSEIAGDLTFAEPVNGEGDLLMEGQQVMQEWQRPLMRELAQSVTEGRGDVLEIGFGVGISANFIQERGVRSHIIIESNRKVVEAARRWREGFPHKRIRIIHAKWQDVVDDLESFDGILFDTFPMTEEEFRRHVLGDVTFAEHFFPYAAQHLNRGGVFTYYSNEIDSLSRRHQRILLNSFSSFRVGVVRDLQPAADSQNWWADSMAVVRAYKD